MKCTNIQTKVNEVKALEFTELRRAIEAHGGFYEWNKKNSGSRPLIAINPDNSKPSPQDIEVTKVAIVDGNIEISGVDNKYGEPIDFQLDDIFAGHISFITEYIPATDKVLDVSIPLPSERYKPVKGGKVWLFNKDRRYKDKDRYGEVTRIARKYLYVKTGIHSEERFDIETFEHIHGDSSPVYELYPSRETCEFRKKAGEYRKAISHYLFLYFTDDEVCELYDMLIKRKG